ncbi:signal transduction histidine kinase [Clostridium pascui]|uniref:sensor histidine kinase n=1 Tax=Clostridium pascui TaxID=46609 RepID=UPI001FAFC76B|nr:HAMP domain-containing sensor histidine kinase [Clostridium pascui]MBM7868766.1 signal transduction histidine kinase [Clostridium pascui]
MASNETEKVIILKGNTLKKISLIIRFLVSLTLAVIFPLILSYFDILYYFQYSYRWRLFNSYSITGFVVFIVCFVFGNKLRKIKNILIGIHNANQKYIMRSIGMEVFVANMISILVAGIVYLTAFNITYWNMFISLLWAVPVYILVFHLLARRKIKYIKEITTGIQEISKGNLDFKVAERGNDEFKILAKNINKMSVELKNKIEDERRAEQTKNELITNVSHDLKTPLTTIIGYLTLVKDKNYDSEIAMNNYVERAYLKSLRLKKLIEDLFEYTKITNGVIKVNKTTVNIVELMDQLLGEMSILAKQNNLSFETEYSSHEIYVDVDSDLMARTFENILSNSIKYSYKELNSKIFISIIENKGKVNLSFENQGDTIPTEVLPLLFERFYRVDKSRNSKVSGSGLGLAIAKSIVELHGGIISAESEANRVKVSVQLNTTRGF